MNWRRGVMTGDPNAPDEYYQASEVGGGEYIDKRIAPTIQTVGGVMETGAGAAMVATGVGAVPGAVLVAHGADTTVAGARGMYSGEAKQTLTKQGVTYVTGSETAGTVVDVGLPIVAGVAGGILVARQKAAQAAAAKAAAAETAAAETAAAETATENATVQAAKRGPCFAAGTPLRSPNGSKPIEAYQEGDWLLSRHEDDPEGPVIAKQVLKVIQSYSPLLHLHVGGRVIRTTAEHPFWVAARGWVAAQQIVPGDRLLGADGEQTAVTLVDGPKPSEPVYNLAIEDYHTYLVGGWLWGFSVWAHNDCAMQVGGSGTNPAPNSGGVIIERNSPTLNGIIDGATHIVASNGDDVALRVVGDTARVDVLFAQNLQHPDVIRAIISEARAQGATRLVIDSGNLVTPNSQALMKNVLEMNRRILGGVFQEISEPGAIYPRYQIDLSHLLKR